MRVEDTILTLILLILFETSALEHGFVGQEDNKKLTAMTTRRSGVVRRIYTFARRIVHYTT